MTDATVVTGGDRPAVRLERRLADPPPVVWQALTDREQLRTWFPCDVVVAGGRWEVGAAISFHFAPEVMEMTLSGEVITVDEPNELAFSWGEDDLRFELSAADGGTRLILTRDLREGVRADPRPPRGAPGGLQGGLRLVTGAESAGPRCRPPKVTGIHLDLSTSSGRRKGE